MLTTLENSFHKTKADWLSLYYNDFRRRIIKLLHGAFRDFPTDLSLSLLDNKWVNTIVKGKLFLNSKRYILS